ncbi:MULTISPECIES: TlyA family RNA methyltransferase [Fusobacterium]|jgi:23S rRNA (cytidine1920-2'-O)/16S rRNA (cytidine1409-2'-O)-methyltransferase|uniref:Hemolysin TlyA family protein n=1 Tax=Fusobacterium ulcerans 12-1B TaxID=457404 RepID=H1PS10_9FUSO|nr:MULTISPECIES: TlyA family RNA methyltransferase [Fusobacterium]EHO82270.2 hemolysin TlyA family protein [Fusobacterium ulcerans 12-1B]MCB8565080.1 TlyA family RNA methyltransferase [Fusobacterium ulcerans]MCB8648993.1 TlyA family RNA methyltransferase [Fusobacterium ulcerans]MDH6458603.1 23S rRNA (cytidine1920-2'-O)/16S rRNA (cytidine1409-2'-O)-methyltransferase [Fusobacterium sp. PH5-7]RGY64038.1 TlyA family rRNA (cytidine-2'-O)-methyltransferase [Fusobacterium ulcerans]
MKERLDILLVKNGFFESKEKAQRAIMAGLVIVDDKKIDKSGTLIKLDKDPVIRIKGEMSKYVSRGGLKLEKALQVFELNFTGKIILDVGASTGGFTDCSLQNGAEFVYAMDVGTNQLDWKLRNDKRVKSIENTHIKDLTEKDLENKRVDYIVMDVSFISITKVLEHLVKFCHPETKLMALIKPQFETDREYIEKGGIVKDTKHHAEAVKKVIEEGEKNGFFIEGLDFSPITGTKGNVEYISIFGLKVENKKNIDIDGTVENGRNLGGAV